MKLEIGEVSDEVARVVLTDAAFAAGGGWVTTTEDPGLEFYLVRGCHRETPDRISWRVRDIRAVAFHY